MNSKKNITVINPPINFWGCIFIIGFFVILVLAYTIFSSPPHTAMYICFIIFILIPWTIIALWTKMYRVKVSGTKIYVRKRLGLVNYNFDISDITNVKWKITSTRYGEVDNITIFVSKGKTFKIETLMVHSDKFIKILEDNVEEHKISKIYKSVGKHLKQ